MNKQEFLFNLRRALYGLPPHEVEERIAFYGEMIDDYMEDGLSEKDAVAKIGPIDSVVSQAVSQVPMVKIVKERIKPKRTLKAWEVILIVLGFPLWLPLVVVAAALILLVYVLIWAVLVCLWTVELSVGVGSVGGLILAVIYLFQGNYLPSLAAFGMAVCCAGVAILGFFACVAASKGIIILTKKIAIGIKRSFIKKERI